MKRSPSPSSANTICPNEHLQDVATVFRGAIQIKSRGSEIVVNTARETA